MAFFKKRKGRHVIGTLSHVTYKLILFSFFLDDNRIKTKWVSLYFEGESLKKIDLIIFLLFGW